MKVLLAGNLAVIQEAIVNLKVSGLYHCSVGKQVTSKLQGQVCRQLDNGKMLPPWLLLLTASHKPLGSQHSVLSYVKRCQAEQCLRLVAFSMTEELPVGIVKRRRWRAGENKLPMGGRIYLTSM